MPKQLEVEIEVKNFDGYKPAFKGAMQAYGILAIKSVRWIQHVTGTGGDSVAHYWPNDCEVCKEIASHVADWSEAAEHTLAGGLAVCSLPGCLHEVYKSGLCVDHYEPQAAKA